jgi:hypothetical protein
MCTAVSRQGSSCFTLAIARLLDKHPTTIHRWLCVGLQLQRSNHAFRARIDRFDSAISHQNNDNATTRYVEP